MVRVEGLSPTLFPPLQGGASYIWATHGINFIFTSYRQTIQCENVKIRQGC